MSRIALNLRRLASRKETESREVQEDLRELMVLRTPVAQLYNLTEARDATAASPSSRSEAKPKKKGPPPLPEADAGAAMVSPPSQFPSMRVGLATTGKTNRSGLLFLVAIALAVLTMSAIALAVVVPSSEWSFLRG